ncbi:Do family serine endopeptidase [Persicimonas caeni]|uniref:Do family serine endopeptidase n=1 Tax=Persicimonas caeni TaxID=2292766 RepID=A0A4Y6Q1X1_PERCE|nr:Do family serine endopeptidase [Persicimonas caeni]QDG53995.1 Do family serine endopeptidase [Persicimonas caeni]QED35216.1 Do family serine endopeptidase [Persicimonas caeni]
MTGTLKRRISRLLLSGLVATALSLGATTSFAQDDQAPDEVWVEESSHQGIDPNAPLRFSSLSKLAEKLSPSVVNIIVSYGQSDEIERLLGKGEWSGGPTSMAQGTGFIIHPDGYILTNNHVVESASAIKIKLLDKTEYAARVVGMDPDTDVALLKIDTERKLPAIALGDSDRVKVGEHVLAIGNPLGLSHTVTTGIVSALGRRDLGIDNDAYAEFIQTDASINPGNSGGPLIGLSGEVIGMNTAINRNGQGIGFAIPINMVKKLLPHLANHGYVVRSWLGIRVQELDKKLAATFGLDKPTGALVTEVVNNSPAAKGGVKAGDVILEFDGAPLKSSDKLPWLASTAGAGKTVDVKLLRGKKQMKLDIKLEKLPDQDHPNIPSFDASNASAPKSAEFGVSVKALTDSLARQLGASSTDGVVVTNVGSQSAAHGAGLRQRDVITEVGEDKVTDSKEFDKAIKAFERGDVVRLKVVRGGRVVYIAVTR